MAFSGSGSGTALDPYVITDVYELQEMQDDLSAYYVLGNDIDASDTENWNEDPNDPGVYFGFDPVGDISTHFEGSLDGRGHKITRLHINRPDEDQVGLIRILEYPGEVRNIGLVGSSVTGKYYTGGVVGENTGTVSNSYNTGAVAGDNSIGGVVGWNDGTVSNSYNTGAVAGKYYIGGVVGWNDGTVSNSYNTGAVAGDFYTGGVVGENTGTVSNSYNTGAVAGDFLIGGVVGENTGTVSNSYWDTETSGIAVSDGGTGKTTSQMKKQATFVDWDFDDIWIITEDARYPQLQAFVRRGHTSSALVQAGVSRHHDAVAGLQAGVRASTSASLSVTGNVLGVSHRFPFPLQLGIAGSRPKNQLGTLTLMGVLSQVQVPHVMRVGLQAGVSRHHDAPLELYTGVLSKTYLAPFELFAGASRHHDAEIRLQAGVSNTHHALLQLELHIIIYGNRYAARVRVKRLGQWIDITNRVAEGTITESNDIPVATLDLRLHNGTEMDSLAPRVKTSPLNRVNDQYAPLLERYNEIMVEAAVSNDGAEPTEFIPMFGGYLGDNIGTDAETEAGVTLPLSVRCYAKQLMDDYIMDDGQEYGPGYASELIQELLDDRYDNGAGELPAQITLKVVGQDDFYIDKPFQPKYMSTWDAIQEFAKQSNKDIRFLWDETAEGFLLTYWTPTTAMVPGWIIDASKVWREALQTTDAGNRYKVTVKWRDEGGKPQTTVKTAAEYRKPNEPMRHALIEESSTSLINNATTASNFAQAVLDGLKSSPATTQLVLPFLPEIKVHDVLQLAASKVRSETETYAVEELRHTFNSKEWSTETTASETVKLRPAYWRSIEAKRGVNDPIRPDEIAPSTTLPVPTGIIAGTINGGISVVWDAPPKLGDWSMSIVRVYDDEDAFVGGWMVRGTRTEITSPLTPGDTYYVTVAHQDIRGKETGESAKVLAEAGEWIEDGSIVAAKFAAGIAPVTIVSALPALPNGRYPIGATVVLTTDSKLYRSTGSAWTSKVDHDDLAANSVTAGAIAAGAVKADAIDVEYMSAISANLGTVTAGTVLIGEHLKLENEDESLVVTRDGINMTGSDGSTNWSPGGLSFRNTDGMQTGFVRGVLSGIAKHGDLVSLPFVNPPVVILQPMDVLSYDPTYDTERLRIKTEVRELSPEGFRVGISTILEGDQALDHTFGTQMYQPQGFFGYYCAAGHSHDSVGVLYSDENLYNVNGTKLYTTTASTVTRIELRIREMMHVAAWAGNYYARNTMTYRVRIRPNGGSWLETKGPWTRSIEIYSGWIGSATNGNHASRLIVFDGLAPDKYDVQIEITGKTYVPGGGDNGNTSCWLIIDQWIESGQGLAIVDPDARVAWLALETSNIV